MDCEKIISLVQERKSLWDPRDSQYHNRDLNRRLWSEIATALNSTSANIKTKWQGLRDTHRREVRKRDMPKGSHLKAYSKWRYFRQMNFLEDTFFRKYSTRAMAGNISDDNTHSDSEYDITDVDLDEKKKQVHTGSLPRKRMKPAKDHYDEFIQIEKAKVEELKQLRKEKLVKEDDDYCFLMSLLPHMRAIPKHRKLHVRMRLEKVLIEETESVEYDSN